jgi:hypothetical protein
MLSVGLVAIVLTGSNPAEDNGRLMAINICSVIFFGGEVNPAVRC